MATIVNVKQFLKLPLTTCVCDAAGTFLTMSCTDLSRALSSVSPFAAISVPVTTSWVGLMWAFLDWNTKHLMHEIVLIVVTI
jgi:hypothetical protein